MLEELEKLWGGFSLTDQERQELVLPTMVLKESISKGKNCPLAMVIANNLINREAIIATMAKVWRIHGWVQVKAIGDNGFLLEFQHEYDKTKKK